MRSWILVFTLASACAGGVYRGGADRELRAQPPWSEEATPVEADPEAAMAGPGDEPTGDDTVGRE